MEREKTAPVFKPCQCSFSILHICGLVHTSVHTHCPCLKLGMVFQPATGLSPEPSVSAQTQKSDKNREVSLKGHLVHFRSRKQMCYKRWLWKNKATWPGTFSWSRKLSRESLSESCQKQWMERPVGLDQMRVAGLLIYPATCLQWVSCDVLFQNLIIERAGRRMLVIGGYSLMAVWAVVFMVALSLQVSRQ